MNQFDNAFTRFNRAQSRREAQRAAFWAVVRICLSSAAFAFIAGYYGAPFTPMVVAYIVGAYHWRRS
jgi:hypothetical protein